MYENLQKEKKINKNVIKHRNNTRRHTVQREKYENYFSVKYTAQIEACPRDQLLSCGIFWEGDSSERMFGGGGIVRDEISGEAGYVRLTMHDYKSLRAAVYDYFVPP